MKSQFLRLGVCAAILFIAACQTNSGGEPEPVELGRKFQDLNAAEETSVVVQSFEIIVPRDELPPLGTVYVSRKGDDISRLEGVNLDLAGAIHEVKGGHMHEWNFIASPTMDGLFDSASNDYQLTRLPEGKVTGTNAGLKLDDMDLVMIRFDKIREIAQMMKDNHPARDGERYYILSAYAKDRSPHYYFDQPRLEVLKSYDEFKRIASTDGRFRQGNGGYGFRPATTEIKKVVAVRFTRISSALVELIEPDAQSDLLLDSKKTEIFE